MPIAKPGYRFNFDIIDLAWTYSIQKVNPDEFIKSTYFTHVL